MNEKKFFGFFKNQRGQAALMDSLFFLAIVSTICTSLFFFMVNYGGQVDKQVSSFYSRDFAADSLKVVSYINVLRTGDSVFSSPDISEYDYLLAMMKEDYADKKEFSCETRKSAASTLQSVLKPFDDSIDYAFYLLNESQTEYLFLLLAVHECSDPAACKVSKADTDYTDIVKRKYYYCKPQSKDILEKQVFPLAGQVDSSSGKVTFTQPTERNTQGIPFIMGLSMWVSKDILVLNTLQTNKEFNCVLIDLEAECPNPSA
jgi:hypothetical protein